MSCALINKPLRLMTGSRLPAYMPSIRMDFELLHELKDVPEKDKAASDVKKKKQILKVAIDESMNAELTKNARTGLRMKSRTEFQSVQEMHK